MKDNDIDLLDKCHFHFDKDWKYEIEEINARKLLGYNRFDLFAILQYIDQKVKGVNDLVFVKDIYFHRINVITGFSCKEAGNENKNSFEDFVSTLNQLIDDFLQDKFDNSASLVPVDCNYVLMDGSHRTCCAAYFNKTIRILRFVDKDFHQHLTSDFLLGNALPTYVADAMALEYCKWRNDIYMLFLWPKAFLDINKKAKADELISQTVNIVYRKKQKLSYDAIRNLMIQIYSHMDWVGNVDNDFCNTFVKANEVWDNNGQVDFFLVEADNLKTIFNLKEEVRDIFQIGLASMHSTDNYTETMIAANLIYNKNSLHHLIHGRPTKFINSHHLIDKFKSLILQANYDISKFIVDSSMIMAVYGIRDAVDLDYYSLFNDCVIESKNIDSHIDFLKWHQKPLVDLIENPDNYFIYNGLKFITLENLMSFKENRKEAKDENDIKLIKAYSGSKNPIKIFWLRQKDSLRRKKIIYKRKLRMNVRNLLLKLHLFEFAHSLYKKLK